MTIIILQRVAFLLMKMLFRCCARLKFNWRKLIFAGAVVSLAVRVLHMCLLSQPVTVSTYNPLNGSMKLSEALNEARVEQFHRIPAAVISQNSSKEMIQKRRRKKDDELRVMASPPPPPPPTPPSPLQRYIRTLSPSDALVFAKKEIERAPVVNEDPELYAPIFRNVSVFKRSYELMEMTLKVYIYREGKRPVFHYPNLKGIYASEGWFMKLIEATSLFVTRDPEQAHLFYLPYSVYRLERSLYVRNSNNLIPLANLLRDYVYMIAAKYPFWNRTHGSDHFLVACHDWGPYTTTTHDELKRNAIKVLCNADLSEGIFMADHDVSLPETSIRTPERPHRYIGGGNRVSQRPILAFFAGKMHGRVRPTLLKYWSKDEDMKIYRRIPVHVARKMSYIQLMKSSRYCICPMGFEVNSPRIVESLYFECVPVIIADNFVLPLSEALDWSAFSVVVAEKDIPKLKEILLAIPLRRYLKMQTYVKMAQKHFMWHPEPIKYDLFHMIMHSIWVKRLNQVQDAES